MPTFFQCLVFSGEVLVPILNIQASPDVSFVSTGARVLEVPGSNPGRAGYLSSWLFIYSAPNCSKKWGVRCCPW